MADSGLSSTLRRKRGVGPADERPGSCKSDTVTVVGGALASDDGLNRFLERLSEESRGIGRRCRSVATRGEIKWRVERSGQPGQE
jgi:hypothetical protein